MIFKSTSQQKSFCDSRKRRCSKSQRFLIRWADPKEESVITRLTNSDFHKNKESVLILLEILVYILVGSREYTDPIKKKK